MTRNLYTPTTTTLYFGRNVYFKHYSTAFFEIECVRGRLLPHATPPNPFLVIDHCRYLTHTAGAIFWVSNILGAQRSFIASHKDTKMLMRYTHLRVKDLVGRLG